MEKTVRRFRTREEAEAADREYWRSLAPDERIRILLEMLSWEDPADAARKGLERPSRTVRRKRR